MLSLGLGSGWGSLSGPSKPVQRFKGQLYADALSRGQKPEEGEGQ